MGGTKGRFKFQSQSQKNGDQASLLHKTAGYYRKDKHLFTNQSSSPPGKESTLRIGKVSDFLKAGLPARLIYNQ